LDVRLGYSRLRRTPILTWVGIFYAWCIITAAIQAPQQLAGYVVALAITVALYVVVAHGIQSFRGLELVSSVVLVSVLFVAGVGVHQGFADKQCVVVDEKVAGDQTTGKVDGRPCEVPRDCYFGDAEPGAQYLCERGGLLGTTSISNGRVRYRGVLQDPNELALAAGVAMPLAFAFSQRRRRKFNSLLSVLTLALVLLCAILTRSRGGQLVFLAVLAVYFFRRYGLRGMLAGAVLALPLLAFGGRSGGEAEVSTMERTDCWYQALQMFKMSPIYGVGYAQFGEYHYLTAHNSYMLALAELGFVGMVLFGVLLYLSFKIPITILHRYPDPARLRARGAAATETPDWNGTADASSVARVWALGLLAAFCGLAVGIFFLSFSFHYVLWIYMGMAGALYSATKAHDPSFEVRFGWRDFVYVVSGCIVLIMLVFAYTRVALH
jgi:O-antigen ligase